MVKSQKKWEDITARFEENLFSKGKSQKTMTAYGSCMRNFGIYYREELKKPGPYVSRLQATDFAAYIDYLRTKRYSAVSTVNQNISALRAFAQFMLANRWNRSDIARGLKTHFVPPARKEKGLSSSDVRRLLQTVNLNTRNGLRDLAILELMIRCGIRVGEISNLATGDVKLHSRSGHIVIRDQKSGSERQVPATESVRLALRKYLEVRGSTLNNEPLFLSQMGNRISVQSVKYLVKKYLCAAGRSDLSARDIRDQMAQKLYQKEKDLALLQKTLGHKHITTTARYVHRNK